MTTRRELLGGMTAAVMVAGGWPAAMARGSQAGTLRVASLKFGSLAWLLQTIKAEGLDASAGLKLEIVDVATNHAGPVALLAGEVDVIVSDWTWAMRQRGLGEALTFAPYSSALGAVMVGKDGAITSLEGLAGKRIGVAGSAIDKSWLLLRAYSRTKLGKDIADLATPVFGAAPLLTEEMRNGRLDAVLNFWTFAARLQGDGFRTLLTVDDMMRELGISPAPPLVGFIWREETGVRKAREIEAFLQAVSAGNAVLAKSDEAWERIRSLVKPSSDAELAAIKAAYRGGIPRGWGEAETRSAEKLMALLVQSGGKELVGPETRFDAKLFHVSGN